MYFTTPVQENSYENEYINKFEISYPNSINNNSDIVNLSELNKEYERDLNWSDTIKVDTV